MYFGALSRGFGTCCLRFKNRVATIPAKLASGWLARLYREGVEPSGSLQKVSDHISRPPFLDLSWRKGSFIGVILPDRRLHARKLARARDASVDRPHKRWSEWMPADGIRSCRQKGTSAG